MNTDVNVNANTNVDVSGEFGRFVRFVISEMKPRGPWLTPFNIISIPVMIIGVIILYYRFRYGLGAVTNLTQANAWGFWLGFDVITGVALAAGAYVITFVVYVMKVDKYKAIVRITILNGFLAYMFYGGALLLELGRPWNAFNPIIGNNFGFSSVLFLITWHFMLYMVAEFIEFSPAIAEWLGWERVRKILKSMTLFVVILGITLSILHQSGLGALFLMAKPKIHPLWYSEFIPILFFVSSIYSGLAMIIFEGTISHKVFMRFIPASHHHSFDDMIFGLAKGAAIVMFVYYFFKALVFVHGQQWEMINDGWGLWYLVEVIGFVFIPGIMFAFGYKHRILRIIKIAAAMALIGIVLNRLNIAFITYNWYSDVHYWPTWQEIVVTLMVIFAELWVLRWVVTRLPVFSSKYDH